MMKNYDQSVQINHDLNRPYFPDHPYKILIIGGSGSGKTNVLLNFIKNWQPDIDKISLYVKDPFKSMYQLLINRRVEAGIENRLLTIHKIIMRFMKIWKTIIQRKKENAFDDMITDKESNKKLSPIVTELFLRGRKLIISLVFLPQSYFNVPKTVILNNTF